MSRDDYLRKQLAESGLTIITLRGEVERLQRIIDSRPAINAGLPESYIEWSQSIYVMEFHHATAQPS